MADPFTGDINPVACFILRVMLEDIPCHGPGLAWPGRLADLMRATISYIQTTEHLFVGAQRCSAKGPERADRQGPGQLGTGPGV